MAGREGAHAEAANPRGVVNRRGFAYWNKWLPELCDNQNFSATGVYRASETKGAVQLTACCVRLASANPPGDGMLSELMIQPGSDSLESSNGLVAC